MAKIKINIDGRTFSGNHPIKWDEVNAKNFLYIAKFFNGDVSDQSRRIALFFDLLGLSKRQRRRFPVPEEIEDNKIVEGMLQMGQFLLTDAPDKWFIPHVWINLKKHYAPQPTMNGASWREFIYVDTLFQNYADFPSGEIVWQIASVLYRRKGGQHDDVRIPFDERNFNITSELWKKVNGYISEAIFFNYRIVRGHIAEMYPRLFPKPDSDMPEPESDEPHDPTRIIWNEMTDWLTEGDPIKKKQYLDGDMHAALHDIEEKMLRK